MKTATYFVHLLKGEEPAIEAGKEYITANLSTPEGLEFTDAVCHQIGMAIIDNNATELQSHMQWCSNAIKEYKPPYQNRH